MILYLGRVDHANLCQRIAQAINDHTAEAARVYVREAHPFGYQEDLVGTAPAILEELTAVARDATWVISTGDGDYTVLQHLLATLPFRPTVRLAVTHAGSAYRQFPDRYNRADRALPFGGAARRFIGCDSLHLAGADPAARPYFGTCPVLAETLIDAPRVPHVTHTPSQHASKGTAIITPVLAQLTAAGLITSDVIEGVAPAEVVRRRAAAHIHVDQLNRDIGGFGQSAIEALGMGCAVLADTRFVSTGGFVLAPPIIGVRNGQELEEWLALFAKDREVLARYRQLSWKWAREYAAPEKVAAYWLKSLA